MTVIDRGGGGMRIISVPAVVSFLCLTCWGSCWTCCLMFVGIRCWTRCLETLLEFVLDVGEHVLEFGDMRNVEHVIIRKILHYQSKNALSL